MAVDMKAEDLYDTSKVKQALDMKVNADSIKRQESFTGTTNSQGIYSGTYSKAFTAVPNLQVQILNGLATHSYKAVSTATGFTVTVSNRSTANIAGLEVLLATTTLAGNVTVDVLATEK